MDFFFWAAFILCYHWKGKMYFFCYAKTNAVWTLALAVGTTVLFTVSVITLTVEKRRRNVSAAVHSGQLRVLIGSHCFLPKDLWRFSCWQTCVNEYCVSTLRMRWHQCDVGNWKMQVPTSTCFKSIWKSILTCTLSVSNLTHFDRNHQSWGKYIFF